MNLTISQQQQQVTDAQLSRYSAVIYDKTGIRISSQKKILLSNRLRRRLKATGISDFDAYLSHLQRLPGGDAEWDAFLQEITTHETYLFRDAAHWEWFREVFLPELHQSAASGQRRKQLRIWSAACSTGDEAHSIACCIADRLPGYNDWKIGILATDIGVGALAAAQAGEFDLRAMHQVPDGYRRRFFTKVAGAQRWTAKPILKQWMTFRQHNLLDSSPESNFDLIFLKNVMIYFDGRSKRTAVEHILRALRPGGMLVTSAAEGITDQLGDMQRVHAWLNRKASNTKT